MEIEYKPLFGPFVDLARDKYEYNGPSHSEKSAETFKDYLASPEAKMLAEHSAQGTVRPNAFSTREQDRDRPPQQWRIDTLIEEGTDVALVAPSKFLKSFLAVYLGYSVATGARALGKLGVSHPGLVFYCAGEGGHSLKDRITACEIAHGAAPYSAERFRVAGMALTLDGDGQAQITTDAKAHILPGQNVALTINDTLNRALNGADEDKSSTASAYLNMLARHRAAVGGSTLTVHHLGKDKLKGMRGSSAFFAGFDTVIVIDKAEKDETTGSYFLTVRVDKQKNGEDGQVFYLQARKVQTPNGPNLALYPAAEDDLRRVAGKQVGLRRTDVSAALCTIEACPGGANEWTGKVGGVPTRPVAVEIVRARIAADGGGREPTEKEIDVVVAALNKGARQGGPFADYVVRQGNGGRQWAVAPGPVNRRDDDA